MKTPALAMMFLALSANAAALDPGQRSPPVRLDRGGLLPVEPSYFELASQTGGDFYFWAPGEFARAGGVQIPLPGEDVLLAYGRLDAPRRSFEIPVESGVRTLTIFAGAQRKDRAVIVRPGGTVLADGSAGVKLQTYSHMTIATIESPQAGAWRIDFEGAGLYSISANVRAPGAELPELVGFDFVEPGGRPGHEGLFPIGRDPLRGENLLCQLSFAGTPNPVQVSFVTGDDKTLGTVPLDAEPGDTEHYLGRCVVPSLPFRVVVSGRDQMGQAFRRTTSPLITPR